MAISRPPPSALPWIAATIGFWESSMRLSRACVFCERSSDCSRVFSVPKILMSAPATNVEPGANQHNRIDVGVVVGARHLLFDGFEHAGAHRIDGRIVDSENGDAIADFVMN